MSKRLMTQLLMLSVVILIIAYDVIAYLFFPQATITAVSGDAIAKHSGAVMGICLAIGYVLGHIFWPSHQDSQRGP